MMKCHNCDKNAMWGVGPEKQRIPLCLDCYIHYQSIELQQQEMNERMINYMTGKMEAILGLPGIFPRFPERRNAVMIAGGVTLNNINVSNSQIGVLNTGNIQSVDATVTVLKNEGNTELATVITALLEAVIKSNEIAIDQKNQIIELLSAISEEAVASKEKRKLSVVKALLSSLSGIIDGMATIAGLWEKAKYLFEQVFSI